MLSRSSTVDGGGSNKCTIMVHIEKWHPSNCTFQTTGQACKLTGEMGPQIQLFPKEMCDPKLSVKRAHSQIIITNKYDNTITST